MYLMQMFVLSKQGLRIGDLERYKDVMPDNDVAQPVCEYPVEKRVKQTKTFKETGEEHPSYVPDFFPVFPDEHSYKESENFWFQKIPWESR